MPMKGKDRHIKRLKKLADAGRTARLVGSVLYTGADMIRAEVHRSISEGSVSGKHHVPSKPGEPPNRDTGNLQGGLEARLVHPALAEVESGSPHARPLEWGTSKMAARPSMRPARDKLVPTIRRLLAEKLNGLVKRSGT